MRQHLHKSPGLNETQLAAIRQLEVICNQADGLATKLNLNTLRHRPPAEINDFLYYVEEQLVGYLALYIFNKEEAEVSALIHPDFRRQGIFRQLVTAAQAEVSKRRIPDFLFICERVSQSGAPAMQAIGAQYDFSEYKMILGAAAQTPTTSAGFHLRPAQPEDIPDLVQMNIICFKTDFENTKRRLEEALASEDRQVWVATLGPAKIGKIQISITESETFINAFCVLPEYRGNGYGKAMLNHVVAQLVAEQHQIIALEVETENEGALSLYKQAGFQVTTAYDYYRLPVSQRSRATKF